ncbi:MAG: hypothetical protein GY822_00285 [Deltaproteobacteria bacterium]|nr:hypothetical protein [Deltaproteobacteria bacterium]
MSETRDFVTPPELANGSEPSSPDVTGPDVQQDAGLLAFTIAENVDLTPLVPLSEVASLTIDGFAAAEDIALPNLQSIEGDLIICHNEGLLDVQFSTLTAVGGDLVLCDNTALYDAAFPVLSTIGGSLKILANDELSDVNLLALTSTSGIEINSDGLLDLELGALIRVQGSLRVGQESFAANTNLSSLDVPNLVSVEGDLLVQRNSDLATLDARSLLSIGGAMTISDNDALSELHLEALLSVQGAACVCSNASLDACDAKAVDDALLTQNVDVTGNDGQCL